VFNWLGRLFDGRSAADAGRRNPVLKNIVRESSIIYSRTPLGDMIDRPAAERLARAYFLVINAVCNAPDPKAAVREKIASEMLRFALFQVLVIPPEPQEDSSGLRELAGISGDLGAFVEELVPRNIALRAEVHESDLYSDSVDLMQLITVEYWKRYWLLETIDAARRACEAVSDGDDWYRPFMHAACANQENLYRIDLNLPSAFEPSLARTAPTAYSILTDIIVSGAADPLAEWRDYHAGTLVPEPGLPVRDYTPNRQTA